MADDGKLVTIGEFENEFDAERAKAVLDNAGIKSAIVGQDLAANLTYNTAIFNIELQVMACDVDKAKQILAEC